MADDVLKKVIGANSFKNGTAVVSVDKLGVTANHKLDTVFNTTYQILQQSGILDTRFDEVRYYSGDSSG